MGSFLGLVDDFGGVQEGLGRNATTIEANAARVYFQIDQGDLHAQIRGQEGRGVAAGAADPIGEHLRQHGPDQVGQAARRLHPDGSVFEMIDVGCVVNPLLPQHGVPERRAQQCQQEQCRDKDAATRAEVPHQAGAGTAFSASRISRTSRISSMMPNVASPMPRRTKPAGMKPSATPMKNVLAGSSRPSTSSQALAQ